MNQSLFVFESSPWWVIVCLLAGAGYAILLYTGKGPWSARTNKLLAILRGLLVAAIALLLLNPMLKQIINKVEDPVYVIAVDNSQSIVESGDSTERATLMAKLKEIENQLQMQDKNVVFYTLDAKQVVELDSIAFNAKSTDLSGMIRTIENDFEGRNLVATVLVSDGIFNLGSSPAYRNYSFPVYTVGLGDTIPKKDLKVKGLIYNKIAFQGNKFPLIAEVQNEGFTPQNTDMVVLKEGKEVARTQVALPSGNEVFRVEFQLDADQAGFHRYTVVLNGLEGEVTLSNNRQSAYLEIVEGKQKILVAMAAPHPDVKALVSALEKNQNYEITQYMPEVQALPKDKFDLVIINEAFDRFNLTNAVYEQYKSSTGAFLFLLGNRSNFVKFNSIYDIIGFAPKQGQRDRVTPLFNDNFTLFTFARENQNILNSFPPLEVPYGEFMPNPSAQVLFYQKVGSINTDKPLITLQNTQEKKIGVVVGEGIWRWRLQEFAQNENTIVFDEFVTKLVQYLSTKEDKRRFRFYPQRNEYFDSDAVTFEAEVYNNIYEPVYGYDIAISLRDEGGIVSQYSFVNGPGNSRFSVGQLPQGVYKFSASTTLDNKRETVSGEFTVKELQLEALELTARHDLLRMLSQSSGGEFYLPSELSNLLDDLSAQNNKGIIYTSEQFDSIIHIRWIFALLLILVSTEWFIRKYSGSY